MSGGEEGKIRRWRVEDGMEVGTPMDAGGTVHNIAVSQDGKWVVSGTKRGLVMVWNAKSHKKVTEFKQIDGHRYSVGQVYAVDVSPDGTRIAAGSDDGTLCVWSLSTRQRLLPPLEHGDCCVVAVKFSPDGRLIAIATQSVHNNDGSVQTKDSYNGGGLFEFPVKVTARSESSFNQSLAWASDSRQLFALSHDGNIHCLDVSTGTMLSKWAIHSSDQVRCIALAGNGAFVAASANSSISFWDTATREQIGSVAKHSRRIHSVAISANYDLVTGEQMSITLRGLCGILPSHHFDNVCLRETLM